MKEALDRHCNRTAYDIVALFTLLQILCVATFGYTAYPDSLGYDFLAREAIGQGAWMYPSPEQMRSIPFLWNVGAINLVVWAQLLLGSTYRLMWVYALLKGASALLVFLIARQHFQQRTALIALLLYVLYPANYAECTSFLSEVPFLFFALSATYCFGRRWPLAAGALLAIANWVRPMGLVFLLTFVIVIFAARRDVLRRCAKLVAGYACGILLIGSVHYATCGRFVSQAQTGWMALMQYSWDHDVRQEENRALFPDGDPMYEQSDATCTEKDGLWRKSFLTWVKANADQYVRQMPYKVAKTYVSDNTTFCAFQREFNYEHINMPTLYHAFPRYDALQWVVVYNLCYYALLMLLMLVSVGSSLRHRRWTENLMPLCVIGIGTLVLMLVGHGETRFHIPFMPFVILSAALWLGRRFPRKS